jgi:phage terminase small subunit
VPQTNKEDRFVEEYLLDLNATQAAVRAGYSAKSARSIGSELLTKPHVTDAIAEAKRVRSERTRVDADKVLLEYAKVAFADMRQFARWTEDDVRFVPSEELDPNDSAAVAEVSVTEKEFKGVVTKTRKMKLHDKKGALDSVARHLGMFEGKAGPSDGGLPPLIIEVVTRG